MAEFEIEQLIARDIADQLENADRDERNGFHEAAAYRLGVVSTFCGNLINLIVERQSKEGGNDDEVP